MKAFAQDAGFTILETLMVVAIIGVVAAIAIPQLGSLNAYFKISGDARNVSNAVAVTKMRAASNFSKTRLYISVPGGWHRIERADTSSPPHWTSEGGITYLSPTTSFSWGSLGTPPPNTQATIGNASPCRDNTGVDITGTACVVFNSRGIPIAPDVSNNYAPTPNHAVYLTDGSSVYSVTVAATGMIRTWQTFASAANWTRQ